MNCDGAAKRTQCTNVLQYTNSPHTVAMMMMMMMMDELPLARHESEDCKDT